MHDCGECENRRILVVDDNLAIHDDFRKILARDGGGDAALAEEEAALFGTSSSGTAICEAFEIDSAFQGQEALDMVRLARSWGRPYSLAFVDMRMPPGWDGVETVTRIWDEDPAIQIVFCTAYSDHTWSAMGKQLEHTDQWLILKKPFDTMEASQLAAALSARWSLDQQTRLRIESLEKAARCSPEHASGSDRSA